MSKLKVDGIRSNSATSDAITLASDGTCTANITNKPNRNKIINGAMNISQRGTTFSPSGTDQIYTLDRFEHVATSGANGDCTVTQASDAPTGFRYSYKVTPDATNTPTAGGNVTIRYQAEGQDTQDLNYGTSSAKSLTISFYAKTATENSGDQYSLVLFYARGDGTTKTVLKSFTPTSTWQRFSFTIAGDTDSSYGIRHGTDAGITITWVLASGPDDIVSAMNTWTVDGGYFRGVTGQDNFMDNTSNEFYLTGVQLEVSDHATDFEHRSVGQELTLCHRYCVVSHKYNTADGYSGVALHYSGYQVAGGNWIWCSASFPTEMRTTPSLDTSDGAGNTGNKHTVWTSTGGSDSHNKSNYHTSVFRDHFTISNYWDTKYGMRIGGYKADAEL